MSAAFVQALKAEINVLQGMVQQLNGVLETYQEKLVPGDGTRPALTATPRLSAAARPADRDDGRRQAPAATTPRTAEAQTKPVEAAVRNSA